jgi:hypothetical protein
VRESRLLNSPCSVRTYGIEAVDAASVGDGVYRAKSGF